MAEDPTPQTEGGEEERLPWLKRADDEPEKGAAASRPLVYAAGAAVALAAVVGLGYAVLQRPHGQSPAAEAQTNLAALEPDQALIGGQVGGNQAAPAATAPSRTKPVPQTPAHHRRAAEVTATSSAAKPKTAKHAPAPLPRAAAERPSPPTKKVAARPERRSPPPPSHAAHRAARPAASAPAPMTGPGTIVQLGAFSTAKRADEAWLSLSHARHLSRFPHRVERAQVHGHTVYRLRVLVSGNRGECGRPATCMVVRHRR